MPSLPPWVVRYLDECASDLLKLVERAPTTALDSAIAQAMQFKKGRGRVNDLGESYRTYQQKILIAGMVRHLVKDCGHSVTEAYKEVAEIAASPRATVQRAYAWLVESEEDPTID